MNTYSVIDPVSHITMKVKPIIQSDNSLSFLFEIIKLKSDNVTADGPALEFFMNVPDFDFLHYLYEKNMMPTKGHSITKGINGVARGIKFVCDMNNLSTAGHMSITIANGKGTPGKHGFTKLETVEKKLIMNITFEQTVKMLKSMERSILVYTIKNI